MDTGEKVLKEGERDRLQGALRGATINVPSGIDLFGATKLNEVMAEDKELYMLAAVYCDAAIRLGKQDAARCSKKGYR